jgi:two-component system, LytTR family, sensor kinase
LHRGHESVAGRSGGDHGRNDYADTARVRARRCSVQACEERVRSESSADRSLAAHIGDAMTLLRDEEARYWLLVGAIGWSAVTAIAFADIGMQRVLAGGAAVSSWADVTGVLAWVLPGAALSPIVIFLFRRFPRRGVTSAPPLSLYLVTGVGYWVGWAAMTHTIFLLTDGPIDLTLPGFGATLLHSLPGLAFNSIVLFSVMAVLFETMLHRREAKDRAIHTARLQSEVSRAETAALAAKLDPHFLFNTIHVASGLMSRDTEAARTVLGDLTELIEESVRHHGVDLVLLDDEVGLVERYLRIQKARFGSRMAVEVRIEPEARRCWVPPLIIQPLVENAVQHGMGPRREGGGILVSGRRQKRWLVLEVTNSAAPPPGPMTEGIGLGGARARLQLLFGNKASLKTASLPSGHFRAAVWIPAVERPAPLRRVARG